MKFVRLDSNEKLSLIDSNTVNADHDGMVDTHTHEFEKKYKSCVFFPQRHCTCKSNKYAHVLCSHHVLKNHTISTIYILRTDGNSCTEQDVNFMYNYLSEFHLRFFS